MVGIAGGVQGKVRLGDVLVSQFAYYYEPSKLIDGQIEHRGRQFNSDLMLYGRAMHYEAAEWKADIQVARSDVGDGVPTLPEVHFAPIACGEKVVADLVELAVVSADFQGDCRRDGRGWRSKSRLQRRLATALS